MVAVKSVLHQDFNEPIEVNGHIFSANMIKLSLKNGKKFFGPCACGTKAPAPQRSHGMYVCDFCREQQRHTHRKQKDPTDTRTQSQRDIDNQRKRREGIYSKYIDPYQIRGLIFKS